MKKRIAVIFTLCLILFVSLAYAHSPSDIALNYDPNAKMLTAIIHHEVGNPKNHYISRVDIKVNGAEAAGLDFSEQDNSSIKQVTYQLENINPGDVISVEAYCSKSGKLEKQIKVSANIDR